MREEPPQSLVDLVGRLGLTTPEQVRRAGRYAGRLAGDLPLFESVWVDALAHAGAVTLFQAVEINAGRGEALKVGPYVLYRRLESTAFGAVYLARQIDSAQMVRLVVLRVASAASNLQAQLESLVAASTQLECENLAPVIAAGTDADRIWAASRVVHGQTTAEWRVRNGRFPPPLVIEIARQMLAGLARLESAGIVDGDLGAGRVILAEGGHVVIPLSGLRGIVRPEEGYARADLQPEAYDYLAPERLVDGTGPTIASDIYACGCLWWHLLAGRPPLAGGSSLAKLRAAHAAKIVDVRRLAPETPEFLVAAIAACTQPAVVQRPRSMSQLAGMLGPPTAEGRAKLARLVAGRGRLTLPPSRLVKGKIFHASWIAAGVVLLAALTSVAWFSRLPFGAPRVVAQGAEETAGRPETSRAKVSEGLVRTPESTGKTPAQPRKVLVDPPVPENSLADLVLPADNQTDANSLKLSAGQRVCGAAGSRATIRLPAGGWVVGCENVRFENIDFVAGSSSAPPGSKETGSAMIVLEAGRAEFRGCSFEGAVSRAASRTAIVWREAAGRGAAELSLPTGQLDLTDCVLRGMAAGVDNRRQGALFLRFENTLYLGPGPLVRLGHAPTADQPVTFLLRRFTLRDAASLVECRYDRVEDSPGKIAVQASDSAFVPGGGGCLVALVGRDGPERLVQRFEWTGQGSVVSPDAVLVGWRGADGPLEAVDEQALAVAGLVRSKVTFAGSTSGPAGASRIVRWQAPLRSADAPGIDETLGVSAKTN